jgi:hypothetical protein
VRSLTAAWERFWFEREIETSRLVALRVVFFGVLGLDQLMLMVEKGYRYGTGNFNVAHFDFLHSFQSPTAASHTALYLICGFLGLRIAAGIAVRSSLRVLTVLYGYAYFSSMHDGYQHHYLMVWLLLISWAIPFHRISGVDSAGRETPPWLRAWGAQLLYAQVAIVYMFTALTKANQYWFDGWALQQQISRPWLRDWLASLEGSLGLGENGIYAAIAIGVFLWQLLAALAFVVPRLRPFACITGPLFHIMVEVIGLEIRWFSYYMIALYYLLLFPASWYAATAKQFGRALTPLAHLWRWSVRPRELSTGARIAVTAVGAIACGVFGYFIPLPGALLVAISLPILLVASEYWGKRDSSRTIVRVALQVIIAGLAFGLPRYANVAYDYYRLQAGDLARRGEIEKAVEVYATANALQQDTPARYAKRGRLLPQLQRYDEALEDLRKARRHEPNNAEVVRGIVMALRGLGRTEEALAAQKQLQAFPSQRNPALE